MLSTFYPGTALTEIPASGAEWSYLALGKNESILTLHDHIRCPIRSMRCTRQGDAKKCQFSHNRSQEKPRRSPCYYLSHNTGMPHFSKSSCYATLLLWKIYISTFSLTRKKNWKRIFAFAKEAERKIVFALQESLQRQHVPWAVKVGPTSFFPRNHTQHLSIKLP